MTILFTMKYWWDGKEDSTRLRNVNFCWERLKELTNFLSENNINCKTKLYDFSPNKMIEDSIHIPYSLGDYKKAEKTNLIIKQNDGLDYIVMFDSDAFFLNSDYQKILKIFSNLSKDEIYVFDLAKLNEKDTEKIVRNKIYDQQVKDFNFSYAWSGDKNRGPIKNRISGLGGVYICDMNILNRVGRFNEKYVGWGGEDGEIMDRIIKHGYRKNITPVRDFSPFHLSHFRDRQNKKYTQKFTK